MKRIVLALSSLMAASCIIPSMGQGIERGIKEEHEGILDFEQARTEEMYRMGVDMESLRMAEEAKAEDSLENPYRVLQVETQLQNGQNMWKYTYAHTPDGNDFGTTSGGAQVRTYYQWDAASNDWANNMQFKLILDENGNWVESYSIMADGPDQWRNWYKSVATYNEAGLQANVSQAQWYNEEWFHALRWTNEYDENGNLTRQAYENRTLGTTSWIPGSIWEWTYDDQGRELTEYNRMYQNGSYFDYIRNEYTYDENGNRLTWQQDQYGTPFSHFDYEYDENGNMIRQLQTRYVDSLDQWNNYSLFEGTYDSLSRPLTELNLRADSLGNWDSTSRASYSYLSNADWWTQMKIVESYNDSLSTWTKDYQETRSYSHETGNLLTYNYNIWGEVVPGLMNWNTVERETYTYDTANPNLLVSQVWDSKAYDTLGNILWIPSLDFAWTYDENGNATNITATKKGSRDYVFLPYNNANSQWEAPDYDSYIATATYLNLADYEEVAGISLNETSLELMPDETFTLIATVTPDNATNPEVYWTSSADSIVQVDVDGRLTAKEEGTATITVYALGNMDLKAECQVKVGGSANEDAVSGFFRVYAKDRQIHVTSSNTTDEIIVADMTGRILYTGYSSSIPVSQSGLYIVRQGNFVEKVIVR